MAKKTEPGIIITPTIQKKLLCLIVAFLILESISTSSLIGANRIEPYAGFILGMICTFLFGRKVFIPIALISLVTSISAVLAGVPMLAEESGNLVYVFLVFGIISMFYDYLRSLRQR